MRALLVLLAALAVILLCAARDSGNYVPAPSAAPIQQETAACVAVSRYCAIH